ncbi:hypothetical protein GG344DRAFT_70002 [Lentinula edodes]|nr:hypothetical protein GG344DRAFT_70002 [Lentinula edodes]
MLMDGMDGWKRAPALLQGLEGSGVGRGGSKSEGKSELRSVYRSSNASQHQYLQIGRDFMVAIKTITRAAVPLPTQLVPLLHDSLQKAKNILGRVLPLCHRR